jgi:O-antigen/teichoic acid export membrane protein
VRSLGEIKTYLARTARSRPVAFQGTGYTVAIGLAALMGALAQILLARNMSVADFGNYGFAYSFLQFVALLFEFGLFLPAARLAARSSAGERSQVVGTALAVYVPVGVAFSITVFGLSFVTDTIFNVETGTALRVTAALAFVVPFPFISQLLAQGVGRLHVFSITYAVGQALFVIAVLIAAAVESQFDVTLALSLRLATLAVAGILFAIWIRPLMRNARQRASKLVRGAREFGFSVYVGRVLSIGTYNIDVLILAAFTGPEAVAFYVLARSFAIPVSFPINGMSNALFPRMARERGIHRNWLVAAWTGSLGLAAAVAVIGPILVGVLFASNFDQAGDYIPPLALAAALGAITGVYNSYLSAQARGRDLRRAGIVLTISNLVAAFALIPPFGAAGAAWASVLALIANLIAHIHGYRRSLATTAPTT